MQFQRCTAILLGILMASSLSAQEGWLLFRGNPLRTGDAQKLPAWDKRPTWQRPLLKDKLDGFPDSTDPDDEAAALIKELRKNADPSLLPGSFPIIVKDLCVYRSYRDLRAVPLQSVQIATFENEFVKFAPGTVLWKGIAHLPSLSHLLERPHSKTAMTAAVKMLTAQKQEQLLWANSTVGSASSDGEFVFGVVDVVFPMFELPKAKGGLAPDLPFGVRALAPQYLGNYLVAYDVVMGKLRWDLGTNEDPLAKESHFLGAPLPLAGRIFVLNEKAGELRLFVIVSKKVELKQGNVRPTIDQVLTLTTVPEAETILRSPLRRSQALQIAQAGDLLICPTNAGLVLAFDRAKMAARWTYRYRDELVAPPALPIWQAACPIIHQNRIIVSAADAKEIHCLDLDGKKKWTAADADGLFVATVHDDIVLVVGKSRCRALKLADGTEKWNVDTGLPAGVGVKEGGLYYLPVKKDGPKNAPAIWGIDLAKGVTSRRINVPRPDALGNLALHRGMIVMQSATHIAAFPLTEK